MGINSDLFNSESEPEQLEKGGRWGGEAVALSLSPSELLLPRVSLLSFPYFHIPAAFYFSLLFAASFSRVWLMRFFAFPS